MLSTILHIIFVINCLVLIGAILLQAGKGGGLGSGFSGGTSTTAVFGGRGPGALLAKVTISCAGVFMVLSLVLAHISSKPQSALDLEGEDQLVGNSEDDVIEEGTLDIKLKALDPTANDAAPSTDAKPDAAPKMELKMPTPTPAPTDAAPTDAAPTDAAPAAPTDAAPAAPTDAAPTPAAPAP